MACLRCGKKAEERRAFCEDCLENMRRHPVKPGTAIHLPQRDVIRQEKKSQVRHREPETVEQLAQLRKTIRWLVGMLAALAILLLLVSGMLMHVLEKETPTGIIGRNYTTSTHETRP